MVLGWKRPTNVGKLNSITDIVHGKSDGVVGSVVKYPNPVTRLKDRTGFAIAMNGKDTSM